MARSRALCCVGLTPKPKAKLPQGPGVVSGPRGESKENETSLCPAGENPNRKSAFKAEAEIQLPKILSGSPNWESGILWIGFGNAKAVFKHTMRHEGTGSVAQ